MGRIVHHLFFGVDVLRVHLLFRKPYQPYWNNREQQGLHKQPTSTTAICQPPSAASQTLVKPPNCGGFSGVGGWGFTENSGCWVVKQQQKNTSITLPKFNMEPQNDGFQSPNLLFQAAIFRFHVKL